MRNKGIWILAGFILLILSVKPVSASEMQFSVQAEIPTNQIDKNKSYFDLRMKPNQVQDLIVTMQNSTKKSVTVNVAPNTATTNDNGIVAYNEDVRPDRTLPVSFKDIATTNKEVTIPAESSQQVKITVKMPAETFDGTVLGGIYFSEKVAADSTEKKATSQVVNRYAYVIGVKLTETDTVVKPELRLNSVKASQVNYRNVVNANIQNYRAAILTDLTITGKVYEKGGTKVLYQAKRSELRMAPNSNFNFGVSLDTEAFKPGKYTFKGVAKSHKQHWKFQKDFEIKSKVANKYNKQDVSLKRDHTSLYIIMATGIVLILLVVIMILIRKLKETQSNH